jgi:predicted metalloprotease with PDZ domain
VRLRPAAWLLLLAVAVVRAAGAPTPVDRDYPGTLRLRVDATDVERRILRVEETVPVRPGTVTLLYPQWLPGNHSPRGAIEHLAGLTVRAGSRALTWQRDPLDVYAFRVQVPAGVSEIELGFQIATPQAADHAIRVVMTAMVLGLQWNQVVLYPAGYYARRIPVAAEVRLPPEWKHASALPVQAPPGADGWTRFASVPLEHLVDSPLFASRYSGRLDLTAAGGPPVALNLFAEDPADIAVTAPQLAAYRAVVREAYAALGPPRYDRYDFLIALSDNLGGIGLEHHRSTEITLSPAHFRAWDEAVGDRDVVAHEFVHSWNGKYRRPARLWTPTFNVPMQDDLLWVYEGLTEYYGFVLATRAGLWTPEFARAAIASTAAVYDRRRPGRQWRPLADTAFQPIVTQRRPLAWPSWQRSEDYYSESVLLWLDVDARLRELSGGARSIDDFSRAFFAAPAREGWVSLYERADVESGLRAVAPFDWARLLRERVDGTAQPVLEGLTRAGWQLVYDDKPNEFTKDSEKARRVTDLSYSLGMTLNRDAVMSEVVWDGPAFKAGLTTNTTLVAVNGRAYSADLLKDAIVQAKEKNGPIELLVRNQDRYRTVRIDWREGLRYPRLQRIEGTPDRLSAVLAPRAAAP